MTPADILTPRNTEHPFRLFFPLACLGAWVALLPWLALLLAPQYAGHFPLHWHAFAFLNLCAGAGFVGFLMTALPAWTDDPAPRSIHSYLLLALWATMLFAMPWPRLALFACDAFWLYLSAYTAWRVIHNRRRNLVSFVITMSILSALSLCYSQNASGATLHQMVDTMLIAVALVNFRVGRVLGNEALKDGGHDALRFIPNPYAKNISALILGLYIAVGALGAADNIQGWLALAVAAAFAARLQDWHSLLLLRAHYVRANYSVSLVLALGYAATGIGQLFAPALYSPARHLLAIAAMLAMVLTIMSIAGIRHSGLKLHFYRDTRLALALLLCAGLSRSLGALYAPSLTTIYAIPAACIAGAFTLYALRYIGIFRRTEPH
ncbi:NnrS protein [Cardiobacterium hominis]|uniref:NnrS protein n=1 Tax=Cardiobacterium hominis (strain ATCC 15826 / DSM 8339 / NCTC 10426 / 6573) TaxID=638300 RepID=C8N7C4_CARH6|nr:NnrS family protein [Cardiobacterium hominis]EEV89500.1 NnrS protein [Cardiobacterium hominis ATCC 15826]VEG77022.1 NnrS protein [Cardiobacterium hominis]